MAEAIGKYGVGVDLRMLPKVLEKWSAIVALYDYD